MQLTAHASTLIPAGSNNVHTPTITTSELDCTMRSAAAMLHYLQLADRYNPQFLYFTPLDSHAANDDHIHNSIRFPHALDS